jgi:hypothetical protein
MGSEGERGRERARERFWSAEVSYSEIRRNGE